jgi:hypothetical protein
MFGIDDITIKGENIGSDTIGLNQPSGFSVPSGRQSMTYTFTPVNLLVHSPGNKCGSDAQNLTCTLGYNEQWLFAVDATAANETITVTSSDPSKVLLTLNPAATGTSTLTYSYTAGGNAQEIYVQGLTSAGSAVITAKTASGDYAPATMTYNLVPSGFILFSPPGQSTVGVTVGAQAYFGAYLADDGPYGWFPAYGTLRPAASSVTIPFANTNPSVGTLSSSSATIYPGSNSNPNTFFTALQVGTDTISIAATPSGYATPNVDQSVQFIVSQ